MADRIRQTALAILAGIILSLSFPNFNLEFLAYFAFLPLFFALRRSVKKGALFLSYICGLSFFGITLFWVRHVSILGYILLILILSIFFGIFGPFFLSAIRPSTGSGLVPSGVEGRYTLYAIFFVPAFWVFLEYVRSYLFTGFSWALLGYSQYLNLPIIQISDITGAYGVSFLIMMINVIIYNLLTSGLKNIASCIIGLFIIGGVLGYGYLKLNDVRANEGSLKISLIQGNVPQHIKWGPRHKEDIFNIYDSLTKEASKDKPDLIIWPETALPGFIEERGLLRKVITIAKDVDAYLLIGAPSYDDYKDAIFNSAVLISKEGTLLRQYDKLHLVPFGEYIPLGLNFLRGFIDKPIGDFTRGNEYTIFQLKDGFRFGVLICFEDIFPSLVRNFVKENSDFMVNITNDALFMKTSGPYQHAQSSVFRAVENRVPVVRAANTGLSCFIDRYGRIIGSVKVGDEEIFVTGYKTKDIAISKKESFYTKFGDIFIFFCIIALVIDGVQRCIKRYL